jgi:hypothetical protein
VSAVNVGDEVKLQIGVAVGLQGLGDHDRAARRQLVSYVIWGTKPKRKLTDRNHRYQC